MPRLLAVLACTGLATAASGAAAQDWRTTTFDLPDGSKAEVRYVGDIPPQVTVSMPVVQDPHATVVQEDVAAAIPPARRVVQARPAPVANPAPPNFVMAGDAPKGSTYHYTLITTNADGTVCTQRTEWTSRGRGKEPAVRRTDTGKGCTALAAQSQASPEPRIVPVDPEEM